jgi:hypothetical protein
MHRIQDPRTRRDRSLPNGIRIDFIDHLQNRQGSEIPWSWSFFEKGGGTNLGRSLVAQFRHVLLFCHSNLCLRQSNEELRLWKSGCLVRLSITRKIGWLDLRQSISSIGAVIPYRSTFASQSHPSALLSALDPVQDFLRITAKKDQQIRKES